MNGEIRREWFEKDYYQVLGVPRNASAAGFGGAGGFGGFGGGPGRAGRPGTGGRVRVEGFPEGFGGFTDIGDLGDLLGGLFRGGGGRRPARGADLQTEIRLGFDE